MRKLFILMAAGLLFCSCCTEIRLVSGNYNALKEQAGTAEFVLDFSQTKAVEYSSANPFAAENYVVSQTIGTIDERNKQAGEDYVRDWPGVAESMALSFVNRFNAKFGRKGTVLVSDQQGTTPYKVIFHVKYLDFGSTGANVAYSVVNAVLGDGIFYGGDVGGCLCCGTIELQDTNSGKTLGIINVDPVKCDGSPSETARLCELMEYCGKWSGKRAK